MNRQVGRGPCCSWRSDWLSHPGDDVPLWIPENGFASLNPPLGAERRGSLSTRTTHPAFLEGLSAILEEVDAQSTIVNPFAGQTKGELFAEIAEQFGQGEASRFLSLTHSCGLTGQRTFRVSVGTQCGVCFGCVVRKASFRASGIRDDSDYIVASTGTPLEAWLRRNSIESSIRAFLSRGIRPPRDCRDEPPSRAIHPEMRLTYAGVAWLNSRVSIHEESSAD